MGEHCGRYLHFPHYLRNSVDVFYAYDHRGHGRSEGLRGYADRFDVFAEDLKLVIRNLDERLMSRFGKSEIHVFAHSFGGLVALYTLFSDSRLPVQSLSLSAPLLGIKVAVPVVKKWAGIALSRVWGSIQMVNEIDPKDISHDPQVISAYVADRLVHNKITPRLFTEMTTAMNQVCKRESGLEYPLLMMIPEEDKITDSEASLRFFRALKQRDKLLKTYPGFYHESFNEIEKTKAFEDLETWLNQHRKPN
jgi:alpha-beta hydrolase superfamily lysophospholipase